MVSPSRRLVLGGMAALMLLSGMLILGCNNTLNPLCGSARPVPLISSLNPSTVTFAQVQDGTVLTVNGRSFVSASEIMINSTALGATIVSDQELQLKLTPDVIPGPGTVSVSVLTPSGNSGDVGCTSGGKSSTLTLTVD